MPRRLSKRTTTVIAIATLGWLSLPMATPAGGQAYVPHEVQVKLVDGVSIETISSRYGTAPLDSIPPLFLLGLPDSSSELGWVDLLKQDPDIAEAECAWLNETPEGVRQMVVVVVGDSIQDYLDQDIADRLHLAQVHEEYRGRGVLTAVLDTGITASHEALAGCVVPGGWDFVSDDPDPSEEALGADEDGDGVVDEGAGHGTMVAGILHLAAPDAQILPIRVLDDEGRGRVFDVAKGIHYAVDHGAKVINLSLGLTQHTSIIQEEILYASQHSVAIVAAAGNLGVPEPPYYPAVDPQTMSIAALDSSDVKAEFSNWHRSVDISGPGVGILAPFMDGGYAIGAGTSFAVPFVTAQCAWILEAYPQTPIGNLYRIAREGVVDIYEIPGNEAYLDELGTGRIDGENSLYAIHAASDVVFADELPSATILQVHPNPMVGAGSITVRLMGAHSGRTARALIHAVDGRLVGEFSITEDGTAILPVQALGADCASGVYFISLAGNPAVRTQFLWIR